MQGLEKYVMTKLFTRVFASHPDDVKLDHHLSEKMALIQQFIRPENLDIKRNFQNETSWLVSIDSIQYSESVCVYILGVTFLACLRVKQGIFRSFSFSHIQYVFNDFRRGIQQDILRYCICTVYFLSF